MAGSGSAWIKPKKRKGLRPDAVSALAHPRFVRPGQRYFPLTRSGRTRATLTITRIVAGSGSADAVREDSERRVVTVKLSRLLELDTAGRGRHYRFLGFKGGRRYPTHAKIIELEGNWARVICPEWHPAIPITVAIGTVPPMLRKPGVWVSCRSDLGAANPARVNPIAIKLPDPGFDPQRYPPVALIPTASPSAPVETSRQHVVLFRQRPGPAGRVYVTGHPPPVKTGDRVYFGVDGQMLGVCTVRTCKPRPNGVDLYFEPDWQPLVALPAPPAPKSGVQSGRHGHQEWTTTDVSNTTDTLDG